MESGLLNGAMSKLVADILPPNEATEAMHISEVKLETLEETWDDKVGCLDPSLEVESTCLKLEHHRISSYFLISIVSINFIQFLYFAWQVAEVSLLWSFESNHKLWLVRFMSSQNGHLRNEQIHVCIRHGESTTEVRCRGGGSDVSRSRVVGTKWIQYDLLNREN